MNIKRVVITGAAALALGVGLLACTTATGTPYVCDPVIAEPDAADLYYARQIAAGFSDGLVQLMFQFCVRGV